MGNQNAKVRLAEVASRQSGRVSFRQMQRLGLAKRTIALWHSQGYLLRVLPHVYAVGHRASDRRADLVAALLYAGPGAALSHATGAWWLGLVDEPPREVHVSTPRRCRSQPGVIVHRERTLKRIWHEGLPVTTASQLLLDLAATEPLRVVRRAMAKADYQGILEIAALRSLLGRGRSGSATLKVAIRRHEPKLARTRSGLEVEFIELCERAGLAVPEINAYVEGWEVDALWRAQRIAVELDGYGNHRSPGQLKRDRRKELQLRSAGFIALRYSDEQLTHHRKEVLADLRRAGAPRDGAV